jgi:hypothetical protein
MINIWDEFGILGGQMSPDDLFAQNTRMAISGAQADPTRMDLLRMYEPGAMPGAGSDLKTMNQFGTGQAGLTGNFPGLLGNVADDYTDVANYEAKYGPENVYSSGLGTQLQWLGNRLGISDAPLPLTLDEQKEEAKRTADLAAQAKAAQAAGKNFKAAMAAVKPKEEEKMKLLASKVQRGTFSSPLQTLGGLRAVGSQMPNAMYPGLRRA